MLSLDSTRRRQILIIFFFCGLGCVACFGLQQALHFPSYLASILVGLMGSFLPQWSGYDHKVAKACIYSGSFASMCSLSSFSNSWDIFLLSFLVGLYFCLCQPYFRGVGGKLGSIAFLSSVTFQLGKFL